MAVVSVKPVTYNGVTAAAAKCGHRFYKWLERTQLRLRAKSVHRSTVDS
jgi:hypothetical protein